MTKIYNEIVIDMNPESSSYGETLHEDSFEYDGPMALMTDTSIPDLTGRDYGSFGRHWSGDWKARYNFGGQEYYALDVGSGYGSPPHRIALIYPETHAKAYEVIDAQKLKDVQDWSGGWSGWANDKLTALFGSEEAIESGTIDVAPDISYQDIKPFLHPETGAIINRAGMFTFLKTLPQFEGKTDAELEEALKTLPNLGIGKKDMKSAREDAYTDIYGIQRELGTKREKEESKAGLSGISRPGTSSFGDESFAQGLYDKASEASEMTTDTYGLAGDKEEDFASWLANF